MMGGALVCRKWRPFRICRHQLRKTFGFITLKRFKYLQTGLHFIHYKNQADKQEVGVYGTLTF